jgi:hypothetical protein
MNLSRPAGCSWQEWEELMREVQHHVRSMAGRALGMCMHLLIRERVVVVAGLALVGIAPFSVAGNLPARPAEEQAAQGREPAVTQKASPQSGAAATPQAETKPPQVTYQDGQLTIVAENALLSEVLAAVRSVMGADIDLPSGVAAQRIWVRLGPGPARRVLRDLLDGTELNYVIQASESDTEGIRSVLLTVRSKSAEASSAGTQVARGPNHNSQPLNSSAPEAPEPEASAPVAAVTPAAGAPPEAPPVPPAAQSAASNLPATPGNVDPAISRPPVAVGGGSEQMIQQLQSMYEQRRQLQMQQNQVQKPQAAN